MPPSCWNCGVPPYPSELPLVPPAPVDLTRLLTSNDIPEVSETPSVLHVVSHTRSRIDLLDAQIESVRATLTKLSKERDQTEERLRVHQAIMSPVRRVPQELLCQIFSLTLPWSRRINGQDVHQPPWHLGHVCARWRHVAIIYPALWRTFHVAHSPKSPITDRYPLPMLETAFLRSGNSPLHVTFGRWYEHPADPRWLDLFLLRCNRWGTIHISKSVLSDALLDILLRIKGQLPILETLLLTTYHRTTPPTVTDYFSATPALREVLLAEPNLPTFSGLLSRPLSVNWVKITRHTHPLGSSKSYSPPPTWSNADLVSSVGIKINWTKLKSLLLFLFAVSSQ
ncbi:hypothetical protein FB451DRAFT_1094888 [Mycena latifolia]|nr:hypothetical protein FB451DRAFT_1094888 [Mycena latifolia]